MLIPNIGEWGLHILQAQLARLCTIQNGFFNLGSEKQMINEVVSANDYEKALKVVETLVQKAEDGDLRATEIILDRVDGKVMQGNTLEGNINHNVNRPLRIVTGIPDSDGRDYVTLIPKGDGTMHSVQDDEYKTLEVTKEQAKKMDEEGWEGTTIEFVDAKPKED